MKQPRKQQRQVVSYPVLVNAQVFDNLAKVEQINTIVRNQYNYFLEKTLQKNSKEDREQNFVRSSSNSVTNVRDYNYGNYCFLSMFFSTSGMEPDTIYPVLSIKRGVVPAVNGISPDISFTGVDKAEDYRTMLNNYGIFLPTYNRLAQEYQLSFKTFRKDEVPNGKIPSKGWFVNINFFYKLIGGDV